MPIGAVIFDFDGVLVDSEPLHFRAMRESLVSEGIEIDEDEYVRLYLAYDDRAAIRRALDEHQVVCDAGRVQKIAARKAAHFEGMLPSIALFPGVSKLLLALQDEVPIAIASGALRGEIEAILRARGLLSLFGAIVGADDVLRSKPDPETYLAALARLRALGLSLRAEDCVAVEDSPAGIEAGLAAGMKVLAVANSYPAAALAAAHLVVPSLEGLRPAELGDLVP